MYDYLTEAGINPSKADFDDSFQNLAIKEHMFLDFVRDHTENVDFIYKGMFPHGF